MKNALYLKGLRLWVQGLLLLALRWAQLKNGFDPETGLSRQSVPGIVLAAAILLLAAAEAAFCFRLPGGSRSYPCCFRPTEGPDLPLLAAGSLLLGGGGALLAVAELRNAEPGVLAIATAAAGIAAAAGILLFVRQTRSGEGKVFPLLPAMIFSVLFLLLVYLPQDSNPVLARYYLPVLAASAAAYALSQLAGFLRRESSARSFVWTADCAVILCLAAMADSLSSPGLLLLYAGCALLLSVFLLLRREGPQEAAP